MPEYNRTFSLRTGVIVTTISVERTSSGMFRVAYRMDDQSEGETMLSPAEAWQVGLTK